MTCPRSSLRRRAQVCASHGQVSSGVPSTVHARSMTTSVGVGGAAVRRTRHATITGESARTTSGKRRRRRHAHRAPIPPLACGGHRTSAWLSPPRFGVVSRCFRWGAGVVRGRYLEQFPARRLGAFPAASHHLPGQRTGSDGAAAPPLFPAHRCPQRHRHPGCRHSGTGSVVVASLTEHVLLATPTTGHHTEPAGHEESCTAAALAPVAVAVPTLRGA